MIEIDSETFSVSLAEEDVFRCGVDSIAARYSKRFDLQDQAFQPSTAIGVVCQSGGSSCIIFAGGGGGSQEQNSAAIAEHTLFLAVGDSIAALNLPDLTMRWHERLDTSTCFRVYRSPDQDGLLVHGECEISKLRRNGEIVWSAAGRDIFTAITLHSDHVEVIDWNGENYLIRLSDGYSELIDHKERF